MTTSGIDKHGFASAPAGVPWTPDLAKRDQHVLDAGGVQLSGTYTPLPYSPEIHPQVRTDATYGVTASEAAGLPAVYRCLTVLGTAAEQLPLTVERNGQTLRGRQVPGILKRPNLEMPTSQFIKAIVTSLAVSGNAYLHTARANGEIYNIEVWNPHGVFWTKNQHGDTVFYHEGKEYPAREVKHIALLQMPGAPFGLGPIQAANKSLVGAVRQRDYAAGWFDTNGQPAGLLTVDDDKATAEKLKTYRNYWNDRDASGNLLPAYENPTRIKVLGKGVHYEPIVIKPKDAQWLEAQDFSTLEIARMFGVPTSLLYAALEGNSMTYTNVEQEWLAFVRFTLSGYIRPIEEMLTDIAPMGQRVRLNYEGLLRPDTKGRYQAHSIALAAGFLTINEVREIEGRLPVPWGDQPFQMTTQPAVQEDQR